MRQLASESQSSLTISVRLNHAQHENNRSPFSVFDRSTWAGFNVKTDEPPQAGSTELASWIWPAGQILPTPDLKARHTTQTSQAHHTTFRYVVWCDCGVGVVWLWYRHGVVVVSEWCAWPLDKG